MIWNLFIEVSKEYGQQELGFLFWAADTVYTILNFKEMLVDMIVESIGVSWYDVWRVADFYLKYDGAMPVTLKVRVLEIETRIISSELWSQSPELISVFEHGNSNVGLKKDAFDLNRLLRRVLHQTAFQIHLLC